MRQRQHTRDLGIVVSVTRLTRSSRCRRARFVVRPFFIRNRHAAFIHVSEEVMVFNVYSQGGTAAFLRITRTDINFIRSGECCDRHVKLQ